MEYKLPPLPSPKEWQIDLEPTVWYEHDQMLQYAEQAVTPLLAEIERLQIALDNANYQLGK